MRTHKLALILSFSYIFLISSFMIYHRIWFSPDQFFIFAILGSLFLGRVRMFLFDWIPFVLLFLGYEGLRSLIPYFNLKAHVLPMIYADKLIFGSIPTITLQNLLYNPNNLKWYDFLTVTLYISHFVGFLLAGYLFWILDRKVFKQYSVAILLVSYMAFFTFIIFPAMPPWMAASKGYIPKVSEVISIVMSHFSPTFNIPTVYAILGADPVAAVPSLHAAFPFLIFLFMLKRYKKLSIIFGIYTIGVWFSIVYLGEHFFVDAIIGAIYALLGFILVSSGFGEKLLLKVKRIKK